MGEGYAIPVFTACIAIINATKSIPKEGTLPWDNDLCYEVKPFRLRSAFGYIVIVLFAGIFTFLIHTWTILPNGNTLTVAEFSENYNHLLEYAELDTLPSLTKDGKWKEGEDDLSFLIFLPNAVRSEPVIQEENGKLSSFSYTLTDTEGDILSPLEQNPLLAMALLRTQIDFLHPDLERISGQLLSSDDTQEPQRISSVLNYMDRHPYCSYTIETGNLRIIQEITLVGYNVDKHNSYSIGRMRMQRKPTIPLPSHWNNINFLQKKVRPISLSLTFLFLFLIYLFLKILIFFLKRQNQSSPSCGLPLPQKQRPYPPDDSFSSSVSRTQAFSFHQIHNNHHPSGKGYHHALNGIQQFHINPPVRHTGNDALINLTNLILHEFHLFQCIRIPFRVLRNAFLLGAMLCPIGIFLR